MPDQRTIILGSLAMMAWIAVPAAAQEPPATAPPAQSEAVEKLDLKYREQFRELHRRQIAELVALAVKSRGAEAEAADRRLFALAIEQNLCQVAQDEAARCLKVGASARDVRALAALVQALARADRGQHGQILVDWKELLQSARGEEVEVALAVGEATLQRLIQNGDYGVARDLCDLACAGESPAEVRDHFAARKARLDRIGKPAPAIAGKDVDGRPVATADLRGKVVLVEFWATWCPPCVAAIPHLQELERRFGDQGFVILGVNVDAMHEDARESKQALNTVRRFLVRHGVTWTNLMSGEGPADLARAFGVEEVPVNFLVGRDGTVIAVEQSGEALDRAIVEAIQKPAR